MTTLGVIGLVTWLVGGLAVGIAWAILMIRMGDESFPPGVNAFVGWVLAPLILAGALLAGVCWALGRVVIRVERTHPSRDALERRIHELEDEMEVGR